MKSLHGIDFITEVIIHRFSLLVNPSIQCLFSRARVLACETLLAERGRLRYKDKGCKVRVQREIMNRDEILDRITIDPGVLVGKGTIRGMRISVEQILEALAAGVPEEELLEDYPALEPEDIRAALPYARASLQQNGFTPWTHEFLHERTAPSGGCERWPCRCPSLRER